MPSQNFNRNGSITIPPNAKNISVDIAGGGGGKGGPDAGASAGQGGPGRRATIYFPDFIGRTLTFYLGSKGGDGGGCSGSANGGNGGGGLTSGGRGGNAGPNGCSGGGGGGGGSSGIYDNYKGGYVAILGGGAGGGGASLNASGSNGAAAFGMFSGNVGSASNGSNGSSCPNDGGGGGGGGAGCPGSNGGSEGFDNNRGGSGGTGGRSGFDSSYVSFTTNSGTRNFGNGFANVSYDVQDPIIDSFTAQPTTIIKGQQTTLSWGTTYADSVSIDGGVGSVSVDGSTEVSPNMTTTYTLTACFGSVCVTAPRTITVYIPPVITVTTNKTSLIVGQCATITWSTTGDGDTIYWTEGGIANGNLNSSEIVCPTDTTTYSAYVTGLGGTSPTSSVEIIVYQIPTINNFDVPLTINYGDPELLIEYSATYANIEIKFDIIAVWTDGPNTGSTLVETINVTPSGSSVKNGPLSLVNGTATFIPTWDEFGPRRYEIAMTATGDGGTVTDSGVTTVIIDEQPNNLDVPTSQDLIKDQAPVIAPETEILSELLLIDDIDINIEIKSNYPIQVDINDSNDWQSVREIGQ